MFYCFQGKGSGALLFSRERNRCTAVLKEKETGALLFYVSQEKGTGTAVFKEKENRCSTVFRREQVQYCSQEKGSGALLFSRERTRCTAVLKEKETGAILLMFQEKETGAILFSRRRGLELYCFQGEGNWSYTAHVSGEGDWCSTVLKEKETGAILLMFQEKGLVLYCYQVKGYWAVLLLRTKVVQGAVPSLLVDSDESRQLAIVKFGKHFGFCFQQKIIGFI